jgi:hypothetical protein
MHVVQTPGVGPLLADNMGDAARIAFVPGVVGQLAFVIAEAIIRGASSPTGEFPFGFLWQPHDLPDLCAQFPTKRLGIIP